MTMEQICRACLSTKDNFVFKIFENVPAEVYTFCTSVEVLEDEDLPKTLCNNCYELLTKYSNFKKTCIESQNALIGLIKNNIKSENEDDEAEISIDYEDKDTNEALDGIKTEHLNDQICESEDLLTERTLKLQPSEGCSVSEESSQEWNHRFVYKVQKRKAKGKMTKANGNVKKKAKKKARENFNKKTMLKANKSVKKQTRLKTDKNVKKRTKITPDKNVQKKYIYDCEICHKKYGYLPRFEAHKLTHEGKKMTIVCKHCNQVFKNWYGHKRHVTNEHSVVSLASLKCSECGKLYKSMDTLKIHLKRHELSNVRMCHVCGKECRSALILKAHLECHKERERECTCEECGQKFYSRHTRYRHKLRTHGVQRYICDICNKKFNARQILIKHLVSHEGNKAHKCKMCDKAYASRGSLLIHQRIHSGERPYQCMHCPKAVMYHKVMKDHMRVHTGEKPYKCTICGQRFMQQGTLWRHKKKHKPVAN